MFSTNLKNVGSSTWYFKTYRTSESQAHHAGIPVPFVSTECTTEVPDHKLGTKQWNSIPNSNVTGKSRPRSGVAWLILEPPLCTTAQLCAGRARGVRGAGGCGGPEGCGGRERRPGWMSRQGRGRAPMAAGRAVLHRRVWNCRADNGGQIKGARRFALAQ